MAVRQKKSNRAYSYGIRGNPVKVFYISAEFPRIQRDSRDPIPVSSIDKLKIFL